jgi:hypothetical protein
MLFNILFLFIAIFVCIESSQLTLSKYTKFLSNKKITNDIQTIFNSELKYPFILDGHKTPYKRDFMNIMAHRNNYEFTNYNFNDFILKAPFLETKDSVIYVNDFMVGNGRSVSEDEQLVIFNIPLSTNIIVFESTYIRTIPYKDARFTGKFNIIEFPSIRKRDIIQYIYDIVKYNNYNDLIYVINWKEHDIENLSFEKINILLFEINMIITNILENSGTLLHADFEDVENNIKNMISYFRGSQ